MITTKAELKEYIALERELYQGIGYKGRLHAFLTQCEVGKIFRYIRFLRTDEFYTNQSGNSPWVQLNRLYYRRKHNALGLKMGISIPVNTFGKGLLIYHSQGIIVHRDSRCGEYCKLHGLNCIGNNDIGVGAKIIGNVSRVVHTTVAAGAAVCKSFDTTYQVLAGVPTELLKVRTSGE